MVWTAPALAVKLAEVLKLEPVHYPVYNANWVVFSNIFVYTLRKKDDFLGIIRKKV